MKKQRHNMGFTSQTSLCATHGEKHEKGMPPADPTSERHKADGYEIPVWVGHVQKWVTGLRRRTTCDDVVFALLRQDNVPDPVDRWALCEVSCGVERQLDGRTRVLRLQKEWGGSDVALALRPRTMPLEFLRSRRRRRRREKDRSSSDESERSRRMEALVQTVLQQERRLQQQESRLTHLDHEVSTREDAKHASREAAHGPEYVLESLLGPDEEPDKVNTEENAELQEAYFQVLDDILLIENRILEERRRAEELERRVHAARDSGALSSRSSEDAEKRWRMQSELNRADAAGSAGKLELDIISRDLEAANAAAAEKSALVRRLEMVLGSEVNRGPGRPDMQDMRSRQDFADRGSNFRASQRRGRSVERRPPVSVTVVQEDNRRAGSQSRVAVVVQDNRRPGSQSRVRSLSRDGRQFPVDAPTIMDVSRQQHIVPPQPRLPHTRSISHSGMHITNLKQQTIIPDFPFEQKMYETLVTRTESHDDTSSDTGLSSMNSDESSYQLATLV